MRKKMQKRTIIDLDYGDLEDLVKKVYKDREYSFVAVEECGNDSSHDFTVDGKIDSYDREVAEKIRKGEGVPNYNNSLLLNVLCADGHLEPGDYLISVCW